MTAVVFRDIQRLLHVSSCHADGFTVGHREKELCRLLYSECLAVRLSSKKRDAQSIEISLKHV